MTKSPFSMGRSREPSLSGFAWLAAVVLIPAAAMSGCGLERPEAPVFESDVFLPIGTLRYTVGELIESVDVLEGDTTIAEPVRVEYAARLDSVDLRERLQGALDERLVTASLGAIPIRVTTIQSMAYSLGESAPFEIPPEGLDLTVPRFGLRPVSVGVPPYSEFEEGTIRSGRILATLHNDLPIPIENLVVAFIDESGAELGRIEQLMRLEPTRVSAFAIDLSGKTIHDSVRVDLLSGQTPGSDGPVHLTREQSIRLDVEMVDLRFAAVRGPVQPYAYEARDSVALEAGFRIERALIESARVPLELTNGLPLPIDVTLMLPEVLTREGMFRRTYRIPATGALRDVLGLDGDSLLFTGGPGPQALAMIASVSYEGSGDRIVLLTESMSLRARVGSFALKLAGLTGILEPQEIEIPPTRARFDLPDETGGIEFTDATLTLVVENGTEASAEVDITIRGIGEGGTAEARLLGAIRAGGPGGPVTTRLIFTPRNSAILDVVNVRPEEITVEGHATVGDALRTVTVRPEDAIKGNYTLSTPLRVRIHETEFEPDPFELEIDKDTQEGIRKDVVRAVADARVTNHLPFAVMVELRFASDSSRVHVAPDVVLDPVRVEAGLIDPPTGRTLAARVTEARVSVDPADIPFFARDSIYGGVMVRPDSSGIRPLEVMTTDWVEVGGMVRFTLEVGGP